MKKEQSFLAFFCKRTFRSRILFRSLQKNVPFFGFFSVLCKRTLRSLCLFHSLEKNGKESNILLGLISRQKLEKRMEKNGKFFFKNGKERNIPNGKERSAKPWRYLYILKVPFFKKLQGQNIKNIFFLQDNSLTDLLHSKTFK